LDELRLQKLQHLKDLSGGTMSAANADRYARLKEQKEQLESNIYAYESRMESLRQSYLAALSSPMEKKKMVHDMVRLDARNNKMRDQIKSLQEDIDVLKDQVAKLERRVNFVQGKVSDQ
jgi:predicted  nucleic acid-binding Zn-ribbon protein